MEIRLIHIDEHDVSRAGVRSLLADSPIHLVGSSSSEKDAILWAKEKKLDISLIDPAATKFNAIEFIRKFRYAHPIVKMVAFTSSDDPSLMAECSGLGVKDYLKKDIAGVLLVSTLQNIYYGINRSTNAEWVRIQNSQNSKEFLDMRKKLTAREEQVLRRLAMGLSNKEIASQLEVSIETVKEHLHRIFRKLDVQDRTQAAVWAVRKGLA
ncbi:MAG: response regulator transcription factor [Planctomycetia bacterium]|nr:response regulator transcription factor [Planctomycetia bacterium]